MATYSKAIQVQAAVSASSGTVGTLYTAPGSSYAIVNIFINGGTSGSFITVGGQKVAGPGSFSNLNIQTIYVGPSQALALVGANVTEFDVSGVEFKNTA